MLLQNIEIQGQKDKLNLERKHCWAPCFVLVQLIVKKIKFGNKFVCTLKKNSPKCQASDFIKYRASLLYRTARVIRTKQCKILNTSPLQPNELIYCISYVKAVTRNFSPGCFLPFPYIFFLPFYCAFPFSSHFRWLTLRAKWPPKIQLEVWGALWTCPTGSKVEPRSQMHFWCI